MELSQFADNLLVLYLPLLYDPKWNMKINENLVTFFCSVLMPRRLENIETRILGVSYPY